MTVPSASSQTTSASAGRFTIDVTAGEPTLVKCKGRLVFGETEILKNGVKDLLPNSKRVVIDLSEVTYLDSTGLGTIVRLYVSAKSAHCELQLVNLGPRIRELFGMARVLSLFESCGEYNVRMP
jgi:anti-sigma B factor antagonist